MRMEYLHKRGVYDCVENPASSLVWIYKPMEDRVVNRTQLPHLFSFPPCASRSSFVAIEPSRSAVPLERTVEVQRALDLLVETQPNRLWFWIFTSGVREPALRKRVTLFTNCAALESLGTKIDPLQRPHTVVLFWLDSVLKSYPLTGRDWLASKATST